MSEHEDDARAFREGSHIVKHWMESHPSLDRFPPFRYRIKRTFKDCLSRQVNEAVAIFMSEETLLNSKNEYMNNCISRVTVNEDSFDRKKRELKEEREKEERLRKLEEFKKEKCDLVNGLKRKRNVEKDDCYENKNIKMLSPDYEYSYEIQKISPLSPPTLMVPCSTQYTTTHPYTVTNGIQCGGVACTEIRSELNICSLSSAWSERSESTIGVLAIEYLPGEGGGSTPELELPLQCNAKKEILSIEFLPENVQDEDQRVPNIQEVPAGRSNAAGPPLKRGGRISNPLKQRKPTKDHPQQVQDSVQDDPSTPHQPKENEKLKDKSQNYIYNLYGWSAWWERVTRVTCRTKKSLVTGSQKIPLAEKIRLSETEKL